MLQKMRQRAKDEKGFTLIELLVVILIIGILAAIAIPSFLNQKGKASDASAKALARTAQTASETVGTDNNGSYSTVAIPALQTVEQTINSNSTIGQAWLSNAAATTTTTAGDGYTVTATSSPTGNTFTIARASNGSVSRTCTTVKPGGCPTSGSW
jgi:type IV pilus assembly protein PilA